jgi:Icc-related predicted phosphoesterase
MRVAILSDLHECHREIDVPASDWIIVCGDFSFFSKRPSMIDDFNDWLGEQPARVRLVVPGNHEYAIEAEPDKWRRRLNNATLLINEAITIEGIKIFGSPVTPSYGGAWGISSEAERERLWRTIPEDTDILITHGGPQGILSGEGGCPALRRAVIRVKPRLHCFGHVHSAYGIQPTKHTLFVNAAILDEDGAPSRKPVLLAFAPSSLR